MHKTQRIWQDVELILPDEKNNIKDMFPKNMFPTEVYGTRESIECVYFITLVFIFEFSYLKIWNLYSLENCYGENDYKTYQ